MTAEDVRKRMDELRAHREKLIANLNVVDGAIQQCDWCLKRMVDSEKLEPVPVDGEASRCPS